jgi:hypothetical protein
VLQALQEEGVREKWINKNIFNKREREERRRRILTAWFSDVWIMKKGFSERVRTQQVINWKPLLKFIFPRSTTQFSFASLWIINQNHVNVRLINKRNQSPKNLVYSFMFCWRNKRIAILVNEMVTVTLKMTMCRNNNVAVNDSWKQFNERLKDWRYINKKNLRGLSPPANYTDRAIAACRRS